MLESPPILSALSGEFAYGAAGVLAAAGFASQLLGRRLPRGMGPSLMAVGMTLSVSIIWREMDWPPEAVLYRYAMIAAAFSVVWAGAATLLANRDETAPMRGSTTDALRVWSLLMFACAGAILLYILVFATMTRLTEAHAPNDGVPAVGLVVLLLLAVSVLAGMRGGAAPHAAVKLLGVAGLAAWWTSLMIPSASISSDVPERIRLPLQPGWWTWTFQLQFALTLVLATAALVQDWRYRRRRALAWPNRLDDLLLPYSRWPGYVQLEAIYAAAILVIGVYQLVRGGRPGWQLPAANFVATLAAGYTCLYMTYRRWSENTAGLGLALFTLGMVSFACAVAAPFYSPDVYVEYVDRMPVVFNAVLVALWVTIALWSWLAGFWRQQLLDGEAWTTTGRMIPFAQRTAFLLSAIAVLIAFQMTRWPSATLATNRDDSLLRICIGSLTIALLLLQSVRIARRRNSIPHAALATGFAIAGMCFVFSRLPVSSERGWLIQHYGVVMAGLALPLLLAAETLETRSARENGAGRAFAAPLWFLALLVLPAVAITGLLPSVRPPSSWVQPATLGILVALYLLAGLREHRRAFLVLGGVLLVVGATTMTRM